jgi:peptide-methionine (S)-S-oxide reductase
MRQGGDNGTHYRSYIMYTNSAQLDHAQQSLPLYQHKLTKAGYLSVTTEITELIAFYYAEEYHQQYLEKNPNGYCGLGGTGVSCPS